MAHAITKPIAVPAPLNNELKYPNDIHALHEIIRAQAAAIMELQTIVAALA